MTLKQAQARLTTRRAKYVVGYVQAGNVLFGKQENEAVVPLSRAQAEGALNLMPSSGAAIFKLTPVKVNR